MHIEESYHNTYYVLIYEHHRKTCSSHSLLRRYHTLAATAYEFLLRITHTYKLSVVRVDADKKLPVHRRKLCDPSGEAPNADIVLRPEIPGEIFMLRHYFDS